MKLYEEISEIYKKSTTNFFAVTGNIRDLILYQEPKSGERRMGLIQNVLIERLLNNNHVLYYSPSVGMRYVDERQKEEFYGVDAALKEIHDKAFSLDYAQTKYDILSGLHMIKMLLASYRNVREKHKNFTKNLIVLIDDADIVFANKSIEYMGNDEKLALSLARESFGSSDFINATDTVILMCESFEALHSGVRQISGLYPIDVALPNEAERHAFIQYYMAHFGKTIDAQWIEDVAARSAGIALTTLKAILKQEPEHIRVRLGHEVASIIEKSLGNHVQVVYPEYGFDHVIGYEALKTKAKRLIQRMHGTNPWRAVAYIGATGTGKDFHSEAFLHEAGIPVIKLLNIKSKWYGETAVIVEKIKMIARSFSKVAIFKPEADKLFPDPEQRDAHQTDQELTGIFLDWMQERRDRGKIFWIFNTSRPQMFPIDFQRRIEIKLPIFDLDGEERKIFIQKMFARKNLEITDAALLESLLTYTEGFSSDNIRMMVDEVAAERDIDESADIMEIVSDLNFDVVRAERDRQAEFAMRYSTYKSLIPRQ